MRIVRVCLVVLQIAMAAGAWAQTTDDVTITVKGVTLLTNGGEETSVSLYAGQIALGAKTTGTFSSKGCGLIGVRVPGGPPPHEGATVAWSVEIVPVRVVEDAITFRLRWARTIDPRGKGIALPSEDIELTMKPGESRPMDSVPVPPDVETSDGRPCKVSATSLRVSADIYPLEEWDRRLMAADLWLVERLQGGGERSQALSIRGLPNRSMPFYFDSIKDGKMSLEILGHVVAHPEQGAIDIVLKTRSRWGESSFDWRTTHSVPSRWIESSLRLKPDEIVELRLPPLGDSAGSFGTRSFSIRLRARQLR